jgi:hypothetical protein
MMFALGGDTALLVRKQGGGESSDWRWMFTFGLLFLAQIVTRYFGVKSRGARGKPRAAVGRTAAAFSPSAQKEE